MHKLLVGMDVDVQISLQEYGIAYAFDETEREYVFYYGIRYHDKIGYTRFNHTYISADTDIKKEYDWIEYKDLYSYTGMSEKEFHTMPLPFQIIDIYNYYGFGLVFENTFGAPYHKGVSVFTILKRYGIEKSIPY